MSKLSTAYMDCITVVMDTRNGSRYRPVRYRAVVCKKDGHEYWKKVGNTGTQLYFTNENAEAVARQVAQRLGCSFIPNVYQPRWVDMDAYHKQRAPSQEHLKLCAELKRRRLGRTSQRTYTNWPRESMS